MTSLHSHGGHKASKLGELKEVDGDDDVFEDDNKLAEAKSGGGAWGYELWAK